MELKKVKCFPELRRETECFTAQIWDNGKHIANVRNDGGGGCNMFDAVKGHTHKDVEKYRDIKTESIIFGMVIEIDETRKKQGKGFFVRKNGEYFTQVFPVRISYLRKQSNYKNWLKTKLLKFEEQGYTVLNTNL